MQLKPALLVRLQGPLKQRATNDVEPSGPEDIKQTDAAKPYRCDGKRALRAAVSMAGVTISKVRSLWLKPKRLGRAQKLLELFGAAP